MSVADAFDHDIQFEYRESVRREEGGHAWSTKHRAVKFVFDKSLALAALPFIAAIGLILVFANYFFNPGPLFYRQDRMGLGGSRFVLWKFRTMRPEGGRIRGHDEALELHRITPLGRILRRTRIDELPNFFNVLLGQMSVIGPRPEAWSHAMAYLEEIPHYGERFRVLPGITGLAQVRLGYADNHALASRKARLDCLYVRRSCLLMELRIVALTVPVVFSGLGAR